MKIKQQIENEILKAYIINQLTNMVKVLLEEFVKTEHVKAIIIADTTNNIMERVNDKN